MTLLEEFIRKLQVIQQEGKEYKPVQVFEASYGLIDVEDVDFNEEDGVVTIYITE